MARELHGVPALCFCFGHNVTQFIIALQTPSSSSLALAARGRFKSRVGVPVRLEGYAFTDVDPQTTPLEPIK